MKKNRFPVFVLLLAATATFISAAVPDRSELRHERKEVAGLAVVFGAEPEPALTDEMQLLVWRVSDLEDEEAYTELAEVEVTITRDGEEYGPFEVRAVRRTPGEYQTRHVFTEVGEYESVLSFKKGEETEVHTVDFAFRIGDRADLEIPKRRGGG